jgi:DNA polymerase V
MTDRPTPEIASLDRPRYAERVANLFTAGGMNLRPVTEPLPLPLPLIGRLLPAGFPSPADDYLEGEIDLARFLIERPAATFFMRVSGSSMSGAGIMDGDYVVVDRSVEAKPGHVVVADCSGDLTIKRLRKTRDGRSFLVPENPEFEAVAIGEDFPVEIWGVVIASFRKMG